MMIGQGKTYFPRVLIADLYAQMIPQFRSSPQVLSPTTGLALLHAAVFLVGFAGLFGKWIEVNAWMIVWGRLIFAVPVLALAVWWREESRTMLASRDRVLLLINGGILAAHWVSFFHAVQRSSVSIALLGYASAPVFAAVMEPLAYRERFSARALIAPGAILVGAALIVPEWRWQAAEFQGMVWALVSGWTFAVLQLLNRRLVRIQGSLSLALRLDIVALLALAPFLPRAWEAPSMRDWALMAVQGVVFTAIAHTLFIEALRAVRAQTVAIVSTLEPVYGIALAAWLLGEIPEPRTAAGGGLILGAVLWTTLAGQRFQAVRAESR
jgi:drug/metabolite transporter (DMT)-like permease